MNPIPDFDLLVRGATVIDGTKAPRFEADVGVRDGRIAAIGDLAGQTAREVIDGTGRVLAPGFIDSHTHDDQAVLTQADMSFKVSQGVTTVIAGNCGISAAPLRAFHAPANHPGCRSCGSNGLSVARSSLFCVAVGSRSKKLILS